MDALSSALQFDTNGRTLAQMALMTGLVAAVLLLGFRNNPTTRRGYAVAAGVLFAALPLILLETRHWQWTLGSTAAVDWHLDYPLSIPAWLVLVWALVAIALSLQTAASLWRTRRWLRSLPAAADTRLERELASVANALGVRRPVRALLGNTSCASSIGGFNVVVPCEHRSWNATTLRSVLAHEMVHLARRDDIVMLSLRLIAHWYWPLPWVRLVYREFCRSMEECCDDRAAALLPSGERYIRGVVHGVRSVRAAEGFAARLIGELSRHPLVRRVERFLGLREQELDTRSLYWALPFDGSAGVPPSTIPRVVARHVAGIRRPGFESPPIYPGAALRAGVAGSVRVKYATTRDGQIVRAAVLESHPPGVFEDAVLRALRRSQYHPDPDGRFETAPLMQKLFVFETR